MSDEVSESLTRQLHELDAELNRLRLRIFRVEHGLEDVANRDEELARLRRDFQLIGDRFVTTYREWSKSQAEESEQDRLA